MRYIVTSPVENGYAWWNVVDTTSEIMLNFTIVSIYKETPDAEAEARGICARLNQKEAAKC